MKVSSLKLAREHEQSSRDEFYPVISQGLPAMLTTARLRMTFPLDVEDATLSR